MAAILIVRCTESNLGNLLRGRGTVWEQADVLDLDDPTEKRGL